ncbi:MAG TPA: hypothetical protein DIS79_09245 [Bacteroidetes bacterium]|nr:hypothetical protein [Bacteroidota bacterium]
MMRWGILVVVSALTLAGCAGDSSPSSPSATIDHSYLPLAQGSSWTYDFGGVEQRIVTNGTATIDGSEWVKIDTYVNGEKTVTDFMRTENGISYAKSGPGQNVPEEPRQILVRNKPVGYKWSQTISFQGTPNKYDYTIRALDTTITVPAGTFSDVMAIDVLHSIPTPVGDITTDGVYFYSKSVGFLKQQTSGIINVEVVLKSYDIK